MGVERKQVWNHKRSVNLPGIVSPVSSAILQCNISRPRHSVENGVAKMKNNNKDIIAGIQKIRLWQYVFKQNLKKYLRIYSILCRDWPKITSLSKLRTSSKPKRWLSQSLKMSFTFGAKGTTHIGPYFYSLWGWPYGPYLAGVLDAAIFFGPKVSWALHWRMWCEGTHAQNYTKPPRKLTMHHLSRCISHWTMMIFQCNVSFQGVHGSKAFKTVAMAMLVTFAGVTFV